MKAALFRNGFMTESTEAIHTSGVHLAYDAFMPNWGAIMQLDLHLGPCPTCIYCSCMLHDWEPRRSHQAELLKRLRHCSSRTNFLYAGFESATKVLFFCKWAVC
eukprot:6455719-Amphidinium_carterae.1